MKKKTAFLSGYLLISCLMQSCLSQSAITPSYLSCENLTYPMVVDILNPRIEEGYSVYKVGSGGYKFKSDINN